jgi:hypothetical protein
MPAPPHEHFFAMITKFFLILIASIIPLYFLLLFVTSTYHHLADLKRRCAQLLQDVQEARESAELPRLMNDHAEAVARYNQERSTLAGTLIGGLFGFPPTAPVSSNAGPTR